MAWRQWTPPGEEVGAMPGPRAAHSCNLIDNKLYVFGGWNGKNGLNDLHVMDLDTLVWTTPVTTGSPPSTRNNHATFVVGNMLYVHGGHDGFKWLSDLYVLDTERMVWSQPTVGGVIPPARACHTTTRLGKKMYMFGGYDGVRCFNDLDVLDMDTMTWIQPVVKGRLPVPRNAQTMTVVGTRLFLFGGHSGNKHLRDVNLLDTETLTWTQPDTLGAVPPGLRGHTANLVGQKIVLFGGYDGRGRSNDLYLLDTETLTWERPAASEGAPGGRQRHSACVVGSKSVFILGGFDGFKWLNDLHILDVSKLEEVALTDKSVATLRTDLLNMINNPDSFPDVVFLVEDRRIYAHKAILAGRSAHFKAMFTSGMRETRDSEIPVVDWSHAAYLGLLEFLYTGAVRELSGDAAVELLSLADHSGIDTLKSLCESTLIHHVTVESVCAIFIASHRARATDLKRYCLEFVLRHFDKLSFTNSLESLSAEPALLLEVTRASLAKSRA